MSTTDKTTYVCDRCSHSRDERLNERPGDWLELWTKTYDNAAVQSPTHRGFDLCADCARLLTEFIYGPQTGTEGPQDEGQDHPDGVTPGS